MNRLIYDKCAYQQKLNSSTAPGNYIMYPGKYEHCSKCRIQLGQVGGNAVSLYDGNMVDLESDLFNINRVASMCNRSKYQPKYTNCPKCRDSGLPGDCLECRSKHLINQPNCQMVDFRPVIEAPPFVQQPCKKYPGFMYGANGSLF